MNESFVIRSIELTALAQLIADIVVEKLSNTPPSTARLVNRKELSAALGVSVPTIDRMVRQTAVPSTRIGKRRLFDVEQVRKAIADRELVQSRCD